MSTVGKNECPFWLTKSILVIALTMALTACNPGSSSDPEDRPPTPSATQNDEWSNEQEITITGYAGHAMEPKVFNGEQFLFWNNKSSDDTQMDIHYATKTSATTYQYQGPLTGVNQNGVLDGVPAVDRAGSFYFVSLRTYSTDYNSIFGGLFDGVSSVAGVGAKGTNVAEPVALKLIMDIDSTADGNFLIVSRADFRGATGGFPVASDLDLVAKSGATFVNIPAAQALFQNVNTSTHLEYAGTLSADGLELYFTRAVDLTAGKLQIFVAKRASSDENFGAPAQIAAITGELTEGPALSDDEKFLYYHKRVSGVFKIYRVGR